MVTETTSLETNMAADAEFAELASTIRGEGLQVTPLKAMNNNADTMVPVYHAITNNSHKVPFYMVDTTEGHSLLRVLFTQDDINQNQIDPKWLGKRVWHISPQTADTQNGGAIYCSFSVHQPKDMQEKILDDGFTVDCRKQVKFTSRYDMEHHRALRHPRRHAAMARYDAEKNTQEIAASNAINAQALSGLLEMMKNQQATQPAPSLRQRVIDAEAQKKGEI